MFNDRRAAQIAAYILYRNSDSGSRMTVLKLMKLMYLVDRESMKQTGAPVSRDAMVSMTHGPVLSQTLNLVSGLTPSGEDGWSHWISARSGNEVSLLKHGLLREDFDELSDAELDVIDLVWREFGTMQAWALRNYTHDHCPEWRDPQGSSRPLSYADVFRALGHSEEEAQELEDELLAQYAVDDTFFRL